MSRKRSRENEIEYPVNKRSRTSLCLPFDDWISPSQIRYCVMDNIMVDWLKLYGKDKGYQPESKFKTNTEGNEIMNMGNAFEDNVTRLIKTRITESITIADNWQQSKSSIAAEKTIRAMKNGVPIIFQGVLHNHTNKTFGMPDILIRSDYINKIVDTPVLLDNETHKSSVFSDNFHYIVIDIKFTTLNLAADQVHLLNDNNFKFYKCQLHIYNEALSAIQGYNPGKAYLLGRRWKSTCRGVKLGENNCFSKLATVDYFGRDKSFIQLTETAIEQKRRLKKEGREWSIDPPSNDLLFPNMCVKSDYDYPWYNVKKEIALRNDEITLVYNCSSSNREYAQKQNINKWSDPLCTASTLGINGDKMAPIIDTMLDINRSTASTLITPQIIENNKQEWQTSDDLELFIDFETANDLSMEDFSHLPYAQTGSRIFLIGVFWIDPIIKQEQFRYFISDNLSLVAEHTNIQSFVNFVSELAQQHNKDPANIKLFHWGHVERTEFSSATKRHNESWIKYNWLDFCDIMRSEPIVVKGSFKFGLKEIARTMYKNKLIKTTWASETESGKDALITVKKCNNESQANGGHSMRFHKDMKDIVLYNYYDCKITYEIIDYFRKNHCQ